MRVRNTLHERVRYYRDDIRALIDDKEEILSSYYAYWQEYRIKVSQISILYYMSGRKLSCMSEPFVSDSIVGEKASASLKHHAYCLWRQEIIGNFGSTLVSQAITAIKW